MQALGRHILVEFTECQADILNDVSSIEKSMIEAAQTAGATVINSSFHHFSPFGVSGVVVIQESHLAIHTWPEYRYAAVDLFTCGESVNPWVSFEHLKKAFGAHYSAIEMNRGSTHLLSRSQYFTPNRHEPESGQRKARDIRYERNVWFTDKDENQALSLRYNGDVLFNEKTPYQQVRVFDSVAYGRMLTINNMIMCTERDEAHYHEMIVHPMMQSHPDVSKVLVIGGGDGGTVRELLRYPRVKEITLVEIDEAVIRAAKTFMPNVSKGLSDPKVKIIVGDGVGFIAEAQERSWDAIIIDGSDPVGPAKGLFSERFYQNCEKALRRDGFLITQGESPMFHEKTFVELNRCLKNIFGRESVHTLLFHATTYPSGMWSLQCATKTGRHPAVSFDRTASEKFARENRLRYYNSSLHTACFQLPNFVREMLDEMGKDG